MFEPRVTNRTPMNLRQKIVVVAMDVGILAELTYSIYLGHQIPEDMAAIFLRTFIPLLVVTVILARFFIKRFGREQPVAGDQEPLSRETVSSAGPPCR